MRKRLPIDQKSNSKTHSKGESKLSKSKFMRDKTLKNASTYLKDVKNELVSPTVAKPT